MSKTISVTVPHQLPPDEARSRIQNAIADLRGKAGGRISGLSETWTGNHLDFKLSAMGQDIVGRLDVEPQQARLAVDVPAMLALLAGGFKQRIENEGRKLLQ